MKRELTPQEVIYSIDFTEEILKGKENLIPEYFDVYKSIETALSIEKEGYNVYLIDSFSKEKLSNIMNYIDGILKKRNRPKDICYVIYDDERYPKAIFLSNGVGKLFKEKIDLIKVFYLDKIFSFYNTSIVREKEEIIDEVQKKRNDYIDNLVEMAKNEGFDVKATTTGFAFIPLKEGEAMTEKEYDGLEKKSKEDIVNKAGKLKVGAEDVLKQLKEIELDSINRLKKIFENYLISEAKEIKDSFIEEFTDEEVAISYMNYICKEIENNVVNFYSMNFEEDEEKIVEIINKYEVNVLVDNKGYDHPRVIFEEDPSLANLIGTIEYENHNGVYTTDVSLITSGSLLNANEGCLIIRVSSLLNNQGSYYYLRKTLMSNKVSYDYNRGYLEFLALNGLKPSAIEISTKVILIGDYETFDILFSYDEDFKKLFRIKAEFNPYVIIDNNSKKSLITMIEDIKNTNKLYNISLNGYVEIAKFLSRKAGNRNRIYFDEDEIEKILLLSNDLAKKRGKRIIDGDEIISVAYTQELVEKEILDYYKTKKILINVEGSQVGSINGLSVIDAGYYSFGKPTRITCVCYRGGGRIIDVQKESNLSGNIHAKSINILRGLMSRLIGPYTKLPVDFHVSFEQIYGMLEGDSASVAEIICIISALSKVPINQSIAVTGSLNQFGEIQAIGGVNDKIEGFFNVCKKLSTIEGKGVLIPESNKEELILISEVEEAVKDGKFNIYTMNDINDAIQVLMCNDEISVEDIISNIKKEIDLFNKK